jgi:FMN phosphatase YigB (HAD superfamily)
MPANNCTVLDGAVLDELDAVLFDIGGVFSVPDPARLAGPVRAAGFLVPDGPEAWTRAHYHGVAALAAAPEPPVEYDPDFWTHYELAFMAALGVAEAERPAAARAYRACFEAATVNLWTQGLAANIAAFARIAAAGVPVGIVSNNDGTAATQLLSLGVCQVGPGSLPEVACVVDSRHTGVAKPDPRIFTPALVALGTEPHRTLYVGDTVHADVAGARARGMPVVQLDPYDLHDGYDHPRLPGVTELADLLLG